jgi:NADPH-dependent 7-cyano-7-deazaguanine reductase QueF
MTLRRDKSYKHGINHVLVSFVGEMQSLEKSNEEIVEAVIEYCDPDSLWIWKEFRQNSQHFLDM